MTDYEAKEIEAIWIEIHLCSQRLMIGTVYRPPDDSEFYSNFQTSLEKIWSERTNVLILGDLNSDLMLYGKPEEEKYLGRKLLKVLNNFNYKNIIKRPRRLTDSTKTIIDLIITSDTSKVLKSGVFDYSIADHKLIYAVLKLRRSKLPPINKVSI